MDSCEMCGSQNNVVEAIVEGVLLKVCENCKRFGNVVEIKKPISKFTNTSKIRAEPETTFEIVSDFSTKVKRARESLKMKQEDLASEVSEKVSEIHNIEIGKIKPSFHVARKLEKFLGIILIEQVEEQKMQKINFKDSNVTIGDLIRFRKSKNE